MYSLLLAIIYLAFVSLGLPDSLLGAGWPQIHLDLDVPLPYMGIVSMIISGGTIISSLLSERLTSRFTVKYVTAVSVALTAVALIGFSFSGAFWMLCVWAIPYGFGAGAIDAALNNYVAVHYSSRHMSWLHCFWGVGTIISPYIMSFAIAHSNWQKGYRIVSYIQFGIVAALLLTLPLWKVNSDKEQTSSAKVIGLKTALKIKGVPFLLFGFFAYCAAEATGMLWASSFLVKARSFTEEQGAAFASLFYIGITLSRFISGFLSCKLNDKQLIRMGTLILVLGIIFIAIPEDSGVLALVGFCVIGFGCGPIYPCIIHSTPMNFGKENSQAIVGIQMASAYVGSTFMPPLFGVLSAVTGLWIMPIYLGVFFIFMTIMLEITNIKTMVKNKEV